MNLREVPLEVSSEGIALACRISLPERPRGIVVLLHGIPSVEPPDPADTGYPGWAQILAAEGWLTAWADMRAVRGSAGYFSLEGWVRDCMAIVSAVRELPEARGQRLALVGSSAGGCVSAEATRRGAAADGLALLAAPAAWLSFADGGPAGIKRITEEAGMAVAPEVVEDPTSWAAEFDAITTRAAIAHVSVPILVIHGTADDVVPVEHAHLIAEAAPRAQVELIEGAGHRLRSDARASDPRCVAGDESRMKALTWAIVGAGLVLALALGLRQGFDATSAAILVVSALVGAVAIAAVRRSERGAVGPARCSSCDGVVSANAPYCKHCGAPRL